MSPREAICQYFGWDYSEASDNRYQPTRFNIPVYAIDQGIACAVSNGKKPAKNVVMGLNISGSKQQEQPQNTSRATVKLYFFLLM